MKKCLVEGMVLRRGGKSGGKEGVLEGLEWEK